MQRNQTDLRYELSQLSSGELSRIIRTETEKEIPDDDLVLTALHILEDREAGKPVELGPKSQQAWEDYQAKLRARTGKPLRPLTILTRAAMVLLACTALFALIPQQVEAGSFWKVLTSWTDDIFQYRNIGAEETEPEEYVFRTDNPGLQQVYDAVVTELGVTEPVVVSWLEDGYVLTQIKVIETPAKKGIQASFNNGEDEVFLIFDMMKQDISPEYYKTETEVDEYEFNGITHNLVQNTDVWLVSWTRQNLKCSIYIDCQEDVVKQIIRSIY